MENIHDLDSDQIENIKNMLNSWDVDNIRMALILLNNANFNNPTISQQVNYLMSKCSGLRFAVFSNIHDEGMRVRFHFEDKNIDAPSFREKSLYVDDESSSESVNYVPLAHPWGNVKLTHNDLNK